jgi:hypothetical protein
MRLLVLLCCAFAVTASPAAASRLEVQGSAFVYSAVDGDKVDVAVRASTSSIPTLLFTPATGSTLPVAVSPCSTNSLTKITSCVRGTRTQVRFLTVGGADKIDASGVGTPVDASTPQEFDTGGGDDTLVAGPLADELQAGAGADRLTGGPGADVLEGGPGDDLFLDLDGADDIRGGDGADTLDLSALGFGVAVSLNGVADDGPLGAGANVDVEEVRGTPFTDLLSGSASSDVLRGAAGDDVIDARDGGFDEVDCGEGADRAIVDAADGVAGCETVELPVGEGAATAPEPAPVPAPPAGSVPSAAAPQPLRAMRARVVFEWATFQDGSGTVARTLRVRGVPAGGRVVLRCSGGGCGFASRVARVRDGAASLKPLLAGRRLRAGAVVEVRITAPGHIGKVTRFRMRRARVPVKTSLCLPPGTSTLRACG